ncbi:unnamed protein product, partial [Vitis vinifera]|uniref:Uncharacterized protein n=1 Tax=Vitis vinifera TaxID=29760 RepID=D7SYI7_VITVI
MGRVLKAIQVATKYKYRHYGCRRLILRDKHKPRMLLEGSSEATHEADTVVKSIKPSCVQPFLSLSREPLSALDLGFLRFRRKNHILMGGAVV